MWRCGGGLVRWTGSGVARTWVLLQRSWGPSLPSTVPPSPSAALPRLPLPSLFCLHLSSASGDMVRGLRVRARHWPVVTWHTRVGGWWRCAWWCVVLGPDVLCRPTFSTEGGAHGMRWCGGDSCCCKRMKSMLISFSSGASISESSLSVRCVRDGRSCAIFGLNVESNC
jgi:hypothetical protein